MNLILPSKEIYPSYQETIQEYQDHGVDTYDFFVGNCDALFTRIENFRTGEKLPEGYVKATYLWLVEGNRFLGEVSIRHSLTDALLKFGGNIGYGVRYTEWNKGIGTYLLSKALRYAKESVGMERVLITCNDDNPGSARVIEKNGGQLWDKITNTIDGADRITRRYWINL